MPYSVDLLVSRDMVSGTVRRGDRDYQVSGRLSNDGKLENTLAPAVSPPTGQPANLNLNFQFQGDAAGTDRKSVV